MAGGSGHYLELSQVPITFDPLDQVQSAFFDQTNFQMFCIKHGFADVRVKGLAEEDNFKITIPALGPVSTIKFSPGSPRILAIQRRKCSVEFVSIFSDDRKEQSLPLKPGNADIVGFYWVFRNEYLVLITSAGVELYQCHPYFMQFKLVKSYTIPIGWAIFSPEELVLVVCVKGSGVIYPFMFRQGVTTPIIKLPKFEVDASSPQEPKGQSLIQERDVVIVNLYGVQYVAVIRNIGSGADVSLSRTGSGADNSLSRTGSGADNSLSRTGSGADNSLSRTGSGAVSRAGSGADASLSRAGRAEVSLFQLFSDSAAAKVTHILEIDFNARFTLSVVDNLVVIHHQHWKTSMLFDIAFGGEQVGSIKRHKAIIAPLSIAPIKLIPPKHSPRASPRSVDKGTVDSLLLDTPTEIFPELYSTKWIFFQPNIIIDVQYGVIWRLRLNLTTISSMMNDKSEMVQLLLHREGGKDVILSVFEDCLEPGRQINLSVLGLMFDLINQAYKALPGDADMKYKVGITQRDVYTRLFIPFEDRKDMPYRFLVAVLVEYIRSLNKVQIPVEHFIFELLMNILVENKCFYQLHQFLQYHIISDSKHLATILLSKELVYSPATQLAMDMFKRLAIADGELVDILLSRGQILTALRYIKATERIDTVPARQFLEAAANEGDTMLFYTVYKFFEERNIRLRKKPEFLPEEHCQSYEEMFQKSFVKN